MKYLIATLLLSTPAFAYDYYDNEDYWAEDIQRMAEHHHPNRVLELDRGGSYSFEEVYRLMHKIGMTDCRRTAREEYDKMIVRSAVPSAMCFAFGRASAPVAGLCATYIGVREWFEKRGIDVRERQCREVIDEKWSIRGERVE